MGSGVSDLPPLPDGFVVEDSQSYDPMKDIMASGYDFTNGYRAPEDIEELKRRGYKPAQNSLHLQGDAIDLVPGKSGKSMDDVRNFASNLLGKWGGKGRVFDEGDHVHLQLEGWGEAPGTPGTPNAGMPDLPPGFEVQQRGPVSKADLQKPVDYSEMSLGGEAEAKGVVAPGAAYRSVSDPEAASELDSFIRAGKPYGEALATIRDKYPEFQTFSPSDYADAVQYHRDHPKWKGSFASAMKYEPLTPAEQANNAFAQSGLGVAAGEAINSALAGAPVALAGEEGNYWEDVASQEHPYIATAANLAGNVAGAVAGGAGVKAGAKALIEGEKLVVPAGWVLERPNLTQTGVDLAMGAGYGAAEAGPNRRLEGAAWGAATTAALEGVGRTVVAPALRAGKEAVGDVMARRGENAALEAAGAPSGVEMPGEAVMPREAAMNAPDGPSVVSRTPDRIDVAPSDILGDRTATMAQRTEVTPAPADMVSPAEPLAKAANINLSKIETPEDIDALMKFTADSFDDFKNERRGVQSWDATEALAKDLQMTPEDLLARRTGEALNAEQALGARKLLAASAEETRNLATAAISGTEADKSAFVKSFLLHAAVTEKAAGAAAEAGRALNIYRKVAKAGLGDKEAMQLAIRRLQTGATVEDVAAMVNSLADDPSALNRFARDAIKPTFKDKLMFVWINSLLSGPKTHIVNMTSNLLTAAMAAPEAVIATGLGKVRAAVSGSTDRIFAEEWGPRFFGYLKGGVDGLQAAKEVVRSAESASKVEMIRPAIGGTAGKIISLPTRLLNAEDEFFKSAAKRSELAGMAIRKARGEGLKGDRLAERVEYLTANPTGDMMEAATEAALYKTFQRPLGPAMQKISTALQHSAVLRLFVPFVRTPTNLLKYAVERTPAAPLLKEVRQEFVAGGAKRDMAIARMTLGTGVGAVVTTLASQGKITGNGPADPSARKALEAQGWQPYSLKIGDQYVSYRRLDPWATVMGSAADAIELQSAMTDKQSRDAGAIVIGAMTQNLASKTWLSGLSDLIDAITDPKANAKNVITRLGASIATPTLSSQVAQLGDPVQRDTADPTYLGQLRKKIESRIPGLSNEVIPRRDILGRELRNEGGPLARLMSPFDTRQIRSDPVAKAIYDSGARFSLPSREVGGGRLPDDAFDAYQQVAAQKFYDAMKETMGADWEQAPRDERRKIIERLKNRTRKQAREELFGL